MAGSLEHREVFDTMGHGALLFDRAAMTDRFVAVVGPRRSLMRDSAASALLRRAAGRYDDRRLLWPAARLCRSVSRACRGDSRIAARLDQTGGVGDGVTSLTPALLTNDFCATSGEEFEGEVSSCSASWVVLDFTQCIPHQPER